jgi:HAD superfamily hydrolase (TIGR01490 family)
MPEVIAFFDMDYTLLDTSSGLLYVQYLRRTGQIGRRALVRVAWWTLLYKLTLIDLARAMPKMVTYAQDASVSEMLAQSRHWFAAMVIDHLNPIGVAKIREHQQQGHVVVVISASTQFAVQPVAEYLGLEYLCTRLAVEGDRVTGAIVPPPCYGEGKITWARQLADRHGIPIGRSYFYTDSLSDVPLLEIVEHPIAVNPDPRLRRLAVQRGWPIEKFY